MIKMNDAFNEKHLMNTYPASLKGEIETQETEKLTPPPHTTIFIINTFWSFLLQQEPAGRSTGTP